MQHIVGNFKLWKCRCRVPALTSSFSFVSKLQGQLLPGRQQAPKGQPAWDLLAVGTALPGHGQRCPEWPKYASVVVTACERCLWSFQANQHLLTCTSMVETDSSGLMVTGESPPPAGDLMRFTCISLLPHTSNPTFI